MNNFPQAAQRHVAGARRQRRSRHRTVPGLDTMLDFTAKAEVNGVKFDGVDIFLFDPHVPSTLTMTAQGSRTRLRERLEVGSVVAPIWPPTGGGSAMGSEEDRKQFVEQVRKACRIAKRLREWGDGVGGPHRLRVQRGRLEQGPEREYERIAETFKEAATVAETTANGLPPRARSAGAACTVGNTPLAIARRGRNQPKSLGFQADMAHTLLLHARP